MPIYAGTSAPVRRIIVVPERQGPMPKVKPLPERTFSPERTLTPEPAPEPAPKPEREKVPAGV